MKSQTKPKPKTKPDDKYAGNDNGGRPKSDFLKRLSSLSDDDLGKECEKRIWLSAYANNNPKSDYHWQADACYDECQRRHQLGIYSAAHKRASR